MVYAREFFDLQFSFAERVQALRSALAHSTLASVDACFPFQVLTAHASAQHFHDFHGV